MFWRAISCIWLAPLGQTKCILLQGAPGHQKRGRPMIGQLVRWNKIPLMKRAVITAGQAASSQGVSLAAACCAFYATLALFPTIAMLISLYGLAYDPDTVQPQLHYLRHFMPPAAYTLISERIQSLVSQPARGLGISFLISLALSLWSSAAGTKSVLNALSLAYGQAETRGIIRFQLVSLGMTLIVIMSLGLLYRYGPAGTGRIFYGPGAGLATVIWLLGSWAFGLYVGRFAAYSATYGPLSLFI